MSEIDNLLQMPEQAVINDYIKRNTIQRPENKIIYLYTFGSAIALAIGVDSYIKLRQPSGDAIRMMRFAKMSPLKKAYLRGLPALGFGAAIYFMRKCTC